MSQTGILLIDKPQGMTSAAVVSTLKRKLKLRRKDKIGHAGTLDPMATGLLICLIGGTTKLASYYSSRLKTYEGTIRLGVKTDTDDIDGDVIQESSEELPSISEIEAIVSDYCGEIMQTPPQVSAVRVNGKRAYARARAGEEFELRPKPVFVESFSVAPGQNSSEFAFTVTCGSGFYVRSLARDIGERFGVGGCLASLRRTSSGGFRVEQALSLESINEDSLQSWHATDNTFPCLSLTPRVLQALARGQRSQSDPAIEHAYLRSQQQLKNSMSLYSFSLDTDKPVPQGVLERPQDGKWRVVFWDPFYRSKFMDSTLGY